MEFGVKRVGRGDAAMLDRIAPEVFDRPVDANRLAAYLDDSGNILLVAIAGGEVVAQCAAVIHRHPDKPTELYVDEVGVTPAMQRQGIATQLMKEIFSLGKSLGCEEAWVGTENGNRAARGLYEKLGRKGDPFILYEYDL